MKLLKKKLANAFSAEKSITHNPSLTGLLLGAYYEAKKGLGGTQPFTLKSIKRVIAKQRRTELFKLIKKKKAFQLREEEALHRPSAGLRWRPEEKRPTCLTDTRPDSQKSD